MVLKVFFLSLLTIAPANAEIDDATCDRIEKTFARYEKPLTCNQVSAKGIREYDDNHYRPMCAGCNPQRQYFGDANNASNDSFDPGEVVPGAESPLEGLNRIPSGLDLFQTIYPGLSFADCKNETFRAEHAAECSDFVKLGDIFYAGELGEAPKKKKKNAPDVDRSIGTVHKEKSDIFYEQYMNSNGIVQDSIRDAQSKGDASIYSRACEAQNKKHAENRRAYNEFLGQEKKAIWTNLLGEMAIKRGCLARYVADLPAHWCGSSSGGQKIDEVECVKSLSAKPEVLFEKFKKFASDPDTLAARYDRRMKKTAKTTGEVQPIRDDTKSKNYVDPGANDLQLNRDRVKVLPGDVKPAN